jgi:predicted  nucleic acid-binding Zn-ribbon protein
MATPKKKKNPADTTMRNIRALQKRMVKVEEQYRNLRASIDSLREYVKLSERK